MGDVADDMIAGRCCAECGVYFVREHGYPVLCAHCYTAATADGNTSLTPRARHREL